MVMSKARKKADFNPEYYSGENLLINGDFSVNQRGADGDWSDGDYAWDRWIVRGADAMGGTITLASGKSSQGSFSQVTTLGATDSGYLQQRIEENLALQGEFLAFSAKVNHSVPTIGAQLVLRWWTNDGTAASEAVTLSFDVPLGESVIEQVIQCPEITDYDSSLEYHLRVFYHYGGGASEACPDGVYQFHWIKLEVGDEATKFVADDFATSLAKCHRYYQESYFRLLENPTREGGNEIRTGFLASALRVEPSITNNFLTGTNVTLVGITYVLGTTSYMIECNCSSNYNNWVRGRIYFDAEL